MTRWLLPLVSLAALVLAGCSGDDTCGPGDAPEFGLVASGGGATLTYGGLTSGRNHDCTAPDAPAGVISLTLEGTQMGAAPIIVFCVPRADMLGEGVQIDTGFRIINVNGEAEGCTFKLPLGATPTGTASASGFCDNGVNAAGYALTVDANVELERTCGASTELVPFHLSGTTAVRSND